MKNIKKNKIIIFIVTFVLAIGVITFIVLHQTKDINPLEHLKIIDNVQLEKDLDFDGKRINDIERFVERETIKKVDELIKDIRIEIIGVDTSGEINKKHKAVLSVKSNQKEYEKEVTYVLTEKYTLEFTDIQNEYVLLIGDVAKDKIKVEARSSNNLKITIVFPDIDTSKVGEHKVPVIAKDTKGNKIEKDIKVRVVETEEELEDFESEIEQGATSNKEASTDKKLTHQNDTVVDNHKGVSSRPLDTPQDKPIEKPVEKPKEPERPSYNMHDPAPNFGQNWYFYKQFPSSSACAENAMDVALDLTVEFKTSIQTFCDVTNIMYYNKD